MRKHCNRCEKPKRLEEFWRRACNPDGRDNRCIACWKRYKKTPNSKRGNKRWRDRLREEAIKHYGGKCACCGEPEYEFLAIAHIDGGGRAHRKAVRVQLPWWLKKNGYPKGFRVLCHNCNMALARYGYCPHARAI